MKINFFDALSNTHKLKLVFTNATFLSCRATPNSVIELFSLADFFVEVWYSGMQNTNGIDTEIKSFKSIELLRPYLDEETSFLILKETHNVAL